MTKSTFKLEFIYHNLVNFLIWKYHMGDSTGGHYYMIVVRNLLTDLGIRYRE